MSRPPLEIIAELRRLEPTVRYRSHVFTSRDADAMCKAAGVMKEAADLIAKLPMPAPPVPRPTCDHCGCGLAVRLGEKETHKQGCPNSPF